MRANDRKLNALETKISEAVEAILPEGNGQQKLRLAVSMIEERAEECAHLATMLLLRNPGNRLVAEIALGIRDRHDRLQMEAVRVASEGVWPPGTELRPDGDEENIVRLM